MSSNHGQQVERAVVDLFTGGAEGPDEWIAECHGASTGHSCQRSARSVVHAATVGVPRPASSCARRSRKDANRRRTGH